MLPHPYQPFIPQDATRLILGSAPPPRFFEPKQLLPGDVDFFYGSRNSLLWPTLARVFGVTLVAGNMHEAVARRRQLLSDNRIAMMDVFSHIDRDGTSALDDSIREGIYHPPGVLLCNNKLQRICCTSSFVFRHLRKLIKSQSGHVKTIDHRTGQWDTGSSVIELVTLWSPSPTARRAGITPEKLLEQYTRLLA